jgi:hypothetical protein
VLRLFLVEDTGKPGNLSLGLANVSLWTNSQNFPEHLSKLITVGTLEFVSSKHLFHKTKPTQEAGTEANVT